MIPVTRVKSIMFAPMMFPKLSAGFPASAELIPTNSSGIDVAKAIIMNAAENSEIPKRFAIFERDFTRKIPEMIRIIADRRK